MLLEPKNPIKIKCFGAKYLHGHNLEELDPAYLIVRNDHKKTIFGPSLVEIVSS